MARTAALRIGPSIARSVPGVLAAVAVGLATVAHADVYKCQGEGGTPVYQESPCPPGKQLRNFQTDPPEITVLPGRSKGGAAPSARAATSSDKPDARPENDVKPSPAAKEKYDPAERAHARVGMSESEVLAKLGPPDVTSNSSSRRQLRWTWLPAEGDPDMVTTMTITDGVVTDLERRTVKK
jgi:hypothetical protein